MTARRACALLLALAACQGEEPPPAPPSPVAEPAGAEPAAFVSSDSCRGCHAAEFEAWQGSHHDLAMQPASEATVLGDFSDAAFADAGTEWRFLREGPAFVARTAGPDGAEGEFEVRYAFGVEPLQQYLVELEGGRLQALTVAWDTRPAEQGGQRWFSLHPDEATPPGDVLHWTGPASRWNSMCAHCHATNLRKEYRAARDGYETTWSELDVTCESCHGPGSRHVAWAEAGASPDAGSGLTAALGAESGASWVMDEASGIARREPARVAHDEVAACAGCHARRTLLSEEPPGTAFLDHFRPALLEEGLYFADGQIRDEVYVYGSFLQSAMYAAGVSCGDCHDPHSQALRAQGDALCGRCHAPARFAAAEHHHHPAGSAGARCVSCHMPSRLYMVVDGRRDHSFRVPRPDLSAELDAPNACTGCHDDRSADWAARQVADWFPEGRQTAPHYGRALHAGRMGAPEAGALLRQLLADAGAPAIVRATALTLLARQEGPASAGAIGSASGDADPLLRMAAASAADWLPPAERVSHLAASLEDPARAVRIEAARVLAAVEDARLTAPERRARSRALAEYRAAQDLDADQPQSHVNLALLDLAQGKPERAERAYRRALAVGDYFVPAYVNLADLYRGQDRDAEAIELLETGLAALPDSADLHHSLGLALVRQGRAGEALSPLKRASELGASARFDYVYAVALHSAGKTESALDVLRAALERHPNDASIREALLSISREAGRVYEEGAAAAEK